MVETHTQIVNRMHSVAHRHHLSHPRGKRFNEKNTVWQRDKNLSQLEQFQIGCFLFSLFLAHPLTLLLIGGQPCRQPKQWLKKIPLLTRQSFKYNIIFGD